MRRLVAELCQPRADCGDSRAAANQYHFVDGGGFEFCVAQGPLAAGEGSIDQRCDHLLELVSAEREVHGSVRAQIDLECCLLFGAQANLDGFGGCPNRLQDEWIMCAALRLVGLSGGEDPVADQLVEIIAAQVCVAGGGEYPKDAFVDTQNRDVEGPAAQVVDQDGAVLTAVDAVGQGRCCGFDDDAQAFNACESCGVLGCLALSVVELGGDRDDRSLDCLAKRCFRGLLEFLQDQRGDLFG